MSESKIKPLNPKPDPKQTLTFADGFLFGCGFYAAGFVAAIVPIAILLILMMLGIIGGMAVQ